MSKKREEFYPAQRSNDGLMSYCKVCNNSYAYKSRGSGRMQDIPDDAEWVRKIYDWS